MSNDSAADQGRLYGMRFTLDLPDDREIELTVTIDPYAAGNAKPEGARSLTRIRGR